MKLIDGNVSTWGETATQIEFTFFPFSLMANIIKLISALNQFFFS